MQLLQAWKLFAGFDTVELIPENRYANRYEQQSTNEKPDTAGGSEEMRRWLLPYVMLPYHASYHPYAFHEDLKKGSIEGVFEFDKKLSQRGVESGLGQECQSLV